MWLVHRTRLGRAMRAVAENPAAAALMGVDINRVISVTFMLGSALAAIAGFMVSANYGIVHYYMGFMLGLKAFTAAVLGGIGNLRGAMVGGVLLGLDRKPGCGLHRRPHRRLLRQQLSGRVRVLRADRGADLPSVRPCSARNWRSAHELQNLHVTQIASKLPLSEGEYDAAPPLTRGAAEWRSEISSANGLSGMKLHRSLWPPCARPGIAGAALRHRCAVRPRLGAHRRFRPALHHAGAGTEHRGRLCRTARSRLHRVLRRGCLHLRAC